jgi:hypothetical protein
MSIVAKILDKYNDYKVIFNKPPTTLILGLSEIELLYEETANKYADYSDWIELSLTHTFREMKVEEVNKLSYLEVE